MNDQLIKLYNEIQDCLACPESVWNSDRKEIGWGTEGRILFIGQAPAMSSLGRVEGQSNFDLYFKEMLLGVGLTEDDFFFTNLVKVPPVVNVHDMPRVDLQHCGSHVLEEIKLIKPIVIVGLGTLTNQWLFDQKLENRFFLQHPSSLKYRPENRDQLMHSLNKVTEKYRNIKGRTN